MKMKKIPIIFVLVLTFAACGSTGIEGGDIAEEDGVISLQDHAQYIFTNEMLGGEWAWIMGISESNNLAIVEDGPSSLFLKFDMEDKTLSDLPSPPPCIIGSGDSLFVDGRYYYFAECAKDDVRRIYRLDTEGGNLEIIDAHRSEYAETHQDSPFIYFSAFDANRLLWVETNLDSSQIKMYDTQDDSIRSIVSYPNVAADETGSGYSSHLVDTYVYDSRIYALVRQRDAMNKSRYVFCEFDENGGEWGIYPIDNQDLQLSTNTCLVPLSIKGNRDYIVIRYWSGECEIYKLNREQHTVEKVVNYVDDFWVLQDGMEYNYHDSCTPYIFMLKTDGSNYATNEKVLYALDTATGEIISKTLLADEEHPYIYGGVLDESGGLLISYAALNDEGYKNSRDIIYYYLDFETVMEIFRKAD